jgi:hypothetical protein
MSSSIRSCTVYLYNHGLSRDKSCEARIEIVQALIGGEFTEVAVFTFESDESKTRASMDLDSLQRLAEYITDTLEVKPTSPVKPTESTSTWQAPGLQLGNPANDP